MLDEGSSRKGLIGVVLLLIVALVVVFMLWQRDQESQDLEIEIGSGDAETAIEPAPQVARALPEGIGVSVA